MPCDTHGPFPHVAVRDLLGITRALYRGERRRPYSSPDILRRLEDIGKQYRLALDLAAKAGDGTLGCRAAWIHAEGATAALGDLVEQWHELAGAVRATAEAFEWRARGIRRH